MSSMILLFSSLFRRPTRYSSLKPINKETVHHSMLYGGFLPDIPLFDLSFVLGEVMNSH